MKGSGRRSRHWHKERDFKSLLWLAVDHHAALIAKTQLQPPEQIGQADVSLAKAFELKQVLPNGFQLPGFDTGAVVTHADAQHICLKYYGYQNV